MKPHKFISWILLVTFTATFVLHDAKFSWAMHSGSTDAVSAFSGNLMQAQAVQAFQPDLFTGQARTGVPLFVPPGRRGMQPSLALSYSSGGGSGWVGVGWNLDMGYIQRSTRKGVPQYNSNDTFVFSFQGVHSELVSVGNSEFRAKDEALFLKFVYDGATWSVWDKNGTHYSFGSSSASRIENASGTFQWCLDRVTDTHGNDMTMTYEKDDGQIYLAQIFYTGNDTTREPPTHTVTFFLEPRHDYPRSYSSGYRISTSRRLKEIHMKVGDNLGRRYLLMYHQSPRSGRSLLEAITEYGTDGTTTLPPVRFFYQETDDAVFNVMTNNPTQSGDNLWNIRTAAVDLFDLDIPRLYPNGSFSDGHTLSFGPIHKGNGSEWGIISWTMNTSSGTFSVNGGTDSHYHAWTFLYVPTPRSITLQTSANAGVQTIFLNWDGNPNNYISHTGSPITLNLQAGYNLLEVTGYSQNGGFNFSITNNLVSQVSLVTSTQFISPQLTGDFTGDGVTDLASFDPNTGTVKVAPSCCFTFSPSQVWITGFGNANSVPLVGDFNQDGKSDILMFDKTSGNWQLATSNGKDAFVNQGTWITNFGTNQDPLIGDFNGDGKQDIGFFEKSSGNWRVALGTGSGFSDAGYWITGWGGASDTKPFTGDFNGDGVTDVLFLAPVPGDWEIAFSDGNRFIYTGGVPIRSFGAGQEGFVADQNGDGLTDAGYLDRLSGAVYVRPSNGDGTFGPIRSWVNFSLTGSGLNFQPAEFTGDGAIDPSVFDPITQRAQIAMSTASFPDLLSRIENGRGGMTTLSYRSSAGSSPDLPMILPLVDQTSLSDGMGNTYTTRFAFTGGSFDVGEREFRGFREARVTDANQNQSISLFYQDDIYKGRLERQKSLNENGLLFTESVNQWAVSNPFPGVNVVSLSEASSYLYDGAPSYKKKISTTYQYDAYGNVTRVAELGDADLQGDERTTTNVYVYNPSSYIVNRLAETRLLDSTGMEVNHRYFYYDGSTTLASPPTKGNLTLQEERLVGGTNPTTTMVYDTYGNLLTVTDARGAVTTNIYDTTYHIYIERITNALGHMQSATYDPKTGQVLTSTDPNGQTATNVYDPLGRIVKSYGPLDSATYPTVSYEYDLSIVPNRVITRSRVEHGAPAEYVTYNFADGLGRTIQTRLPSEDSAKQVVQGGANFDARGLVKEQWMPYFENFSATYVAPNLTVPKITFTYEPHPMARRTRVDYPDGTNSQSSYDAWTRTEIDPNGHSKRYTSDAYGRLMEVNEYNGINTYTTRYTYDVKGNLINCVDAQGNVVSMTYDSLGRKTAMNDPDMGNWNYSYDVNGNLVSQTDTKGQTILFTYDSLNRVTKKESPIPGGLPVTLAAYTYDTGANSVGRLVRVNDGSGTTTFGYDVLGRTVQETKTVNSTPYTVNRSYDALSRLKTLTYPDGEVVTYTYNGLGDVETITGATSYVTNVDYNAAGQITKIAYGNGVATDYTYNPQTLRLDSLIARSPNSSLLQDFRYSFDGAGNVTSIQDSVHTATQSFGYDDLNRLTSAVGSYGSFSYQYDAIGNLTNKEGVLQSYGVAGSKPHAITSASNGMTFEYDANGNMATKKKNGVLDQTLRYDIENRLTEVVNENSASTTSLTYTLSPGWNFITFPTLPTNKAISSVLGSLTFSTDYNQVSRYNATTQKFEHYVNDSTFNEFTTLEEGRGYEIFVTNPAGASFTLQVSSLTVNQSLKTGYNLIGSPSPNSISKQEALNNLVQGTDYDSLKTYNGTSFIEATTLDPGKSYFIRMLRLATWTPPKAPKTTRFTYDGDGGRVKKELLASDSSLITSTTYIGGLYEKTGSSATKYVMLGDQRVASKEGSTTSFYHTDHLGSSNVITDSSGNQIQLLEYTPYGSIQKNEGSKDVFHKFTGQRLDDTTGLYFYNARYYDHQCGRFIQADSIVPDFVDPQSFNRYTYGRNNPIAYVDPSGNFFQFIFAAIAAIASFTASVTTAVISATFTTLSTVGAFAAAHPIIASSTLGAFSGGISASQGGGNIFQGIAFGAALGALTGYIGSEVTSAFLSSSSPFAQGGFSTLDKAFITGTEFGIAGSGLGAINAYAGGEGSLRDVLKGAGLGFGYGFAAGGLVGLTNSFGLPIHGANFKNPKFSDKVLPFVVAGSQVSAVTPTPFDDAIFLGLTVALGGYTISQAGKFQWPLPLEGAPGPDSTPQYSSTNPNFPKPPSKKPFWWHIAGAFAAGAKLGSEIYKAYTGRDPLQERSTYGK